jgi:hypothetical protein
MQPDNFVEGLDIFTGKVDAQCEVNSYYGEIHTGNAWKLAVQCFCGFEGKYMPFGMVIFSNKSHCNKSHMDQHESLSVMQITFMTTFFNRKMKNNPIS